MTTYPTSHARLGEVIREARQRAGISQSALARRAGTGQAAISRIERGLEQPTAERAEQILAALGWRLGYQLAPVAEHDAEPARLYEAAGSTLSEQLEQGIAWMSVAGDLLSDRA